MVKIAVIGEGAREHAIGWSCAQDPAVSMVYYAPGNHATAVEWKGQNLHFDATDPVFFDRLVDMVKREEIDLIIPGPEGTLVKDITGYCHQEGIERIFGPKAGAARIESDKFFSHQVMKQLGIPQAESIPCESIDEAVDAIEMLATEKGVVPKARGLTEGKGVFVCNSKEEALHRLPEFVKRFRYYSEQTKRLEPHVLVAERLFGPEFSVFGISDGDRVVPLEVFVRDYKRLLNGNRGPNTGGNGSYAVLDNLDKVRDVCDHMMTPVVRYLKQDGREFVGFLYAAVIETKDGLKILEYNCRLGDPEFQSIAMMLEGGLYLPVKLALERKLEKVEFKEGAAVCVVMSSLGYPYPDRTAAGFPIGGLEEASELPGVKIFNAGTELRDGWVVTGPGRQVSVCAYARGGLGIARENCYKAVNIIDKATQNLNHGYQVLQFRDDIAALA